MMAAQDPTLDLDTLPKRLAAVLESAVEGAEIDVTRRGERLGQLRFIAVQSPTALQGNVVHHDNTEDATHRGSPATSGITVVATAMPLSDAARAHLSAEFGTDYIVVDLKEAPESTEVLIVQPVSTQLIAILQRQFPSARIMVVEIDDEQLGVEFPGPVQRILDAGASAYVPPGDLSNLASTVRRILTDDAPALTEGSAGSGSTALPQGNPVDRPSRTLPD